MRKPLTVGILAETKNLWERRAPLTPKDVKWLTQRKIPVEVMSSPLRIFPAKQYEKAGARVVKSFRKANLLIGVKEPQAESLLPGKVYLVFSHTTKGQSSNRKLIRAFLKKKITLIDYEHMVDPSKERLVYFGRFAGICGMIDCLHYLGRRYESFGISTPFRRVRRSLDYGGFRKAKRHLSSVAREIRANGFPKEITPFVIGLTGHGNVSLGAQEVLDIFRPIEIHPRDMLEFTRHQRKEKKKIYKIVFHREEKFRSKRKKGFYFEEYLSKPKRFESNLDRYLPYLSILIHSSYWDKRYPRLVTEKMIRNMSAADPRSRLTLIGDLSCDVGGSIEITKKTGSPGNPIFVYDPVSRSVRDGWTGRGVSVLAVDNLPCEFPKDASAEFSSLIRDYVYQIAAHGVTDITNHAALSREVRHAVITQNGRLAKPFRYMTKFL